MVLGGWGDAVNRVCRAIGLFAGFVVIGHSQAAASNSTRGASFGSFARRPTVNVIWSEEVGRISSKGAHAVITALVLEDPGEQPARRSGIRIALTEANSGDEIYVDASRLELVVDALIEISDQTPEFLLHHPASRTTDSSSSACLGSGKLWQGQGGPFSPSICVFPSSQFGLLVNTAHGSFRFDGVTSAPFAVALTRAIDKLNSH